MAYLYTLFGREIEVENKVGYALIQQYERRFPNDEGYVEGKAEQIRTMDMASCLLNWFNLDIEGQRAFADCLGMPIDMLQDTCNGLKWIVNN